MVKPYTNIHKPDLIKLIKLNTPTYFDVAEEIDFIKYLEEGLEDYYVVEEEGKIIGCGGINYEPDKHVAIISWDIIHPNFQGRGLGKDLLNYRVNRIKKKGLYSQVIVRTSQLTFKFYEKAGFKLTKSVKDYWAKGIDLYYMVLKLNPSYQSPS